MSHNKELIDEWANNQEEDQDILTMDGFDEAILGHGGQCNQDSLVVYSLRKMIDICMTDSDMDYETAVEYLEFNTLCAYMGPGTPIIVDDIHFEQPSFEKVN